MLSTKDVLNRVHKAIEQMAPERDKYADFVFILRSIRESYKISQKEMASLLNVKQAAMSKFESTALKMRLDFLISYANLLGYEIIVADESKSGDAVSLFNERQSRISNELLDVEAFQIEAALQAMSLRGETPSERIIEQKKRIITKLLEAKSNRHKLFFKKLGEELSTDADLSVLYPKEVEDKEVTEMLAKNFKVSKRMIRQFEKNADYMPKSSLVFKYANHMSVELRLSEKYMDQEETIGTFYIRNCLSLHNAIAKSADIVAKVLKVARKLTRGADKYAEFVFALRRIRESYQISQKEMAMLMSTSQRKISNFEAVNPNTRLDFLLFYSTLFGYEVEVDFFRSENELSLFYERQAQVVTDLSCLSPLQRAEKYYSRVHHKSEWPEELVKKIRRKIMFDLMIAKYNMNAETLGEYHTYITLPRHQRKTMTDRFPDTLEGFNQKQLAKSLWSSERTIRRFESDQNYIPSASLAFRYAAFAKVELRLRRKINFYDRAETTGAFYLRRIFLLHDWLGNPHTELPLR